MQTITIGDKAVNETIPVTISFSDLLQFGESINGSASSAIVQSGTDPNPSAILSGVPTYTATTTTQNITGGVAGNIYAVQIIVTGTNSHNYAKVFFVGVLPNTGLT